MLTIWDSNNQIGCLEPEYEVRNIKINCQLWPNCITKLAFSLASREIKVYPTGMFRLTNNWNWAYIFGGIMTIQGSSNPFWCLEQESQFRNIKIDCQLWPNCISKLLFLLALRVKKVYPTGMFGLTNKRNWAYIFGMNVDYLGTQ